MHYSELGWPATRVPGHEGARYDGEVEGVQVVVLAGRVHLYEGHGPAAVVHAVREVVSEGCDVVVLTNAAGGIDESYEVGDFVLVRDHLNLTGANPLVGTPSFVDMTEVYDRGLRELARGVDPSLKEGVYAGVLGPTYETPAEIRMLGTMGASLVGMSTVHEAIAARALGARVLAISVVTNAASGRAPKLDHEDVRRVAARAAGRMESLLRAVVASAGAGPPSAAG